jgi:GntR family transcriptional regulator
MASDSPPAVIPHYVRIANDLRDRIKDGTYGPGALLPSRNELAAQHSVSTITSRDALSLLCQEGYARAIRGRGHIVRRQRARLTAPGRLYTPGIPDPGAPVLLHQLDIYQEAPPDNIALPLETGADTTVWVRRAVFAATADRQPIHIHVSWLPGLGDEAEKTLLAAEPHTPWPEAVQQITGRTIATVLQNTRARGANPFEADTFGIPGGSTILVTHLTTYDAKRRPIEHSRYAWPTDAIRLSDYYSYSQRL